MQAPWPPPTRCQEHSLPTKYNNPKCQDRAKGSQRAKVVQAEDLYSGASPHWTSGEERDQRKAASEENKASQFPELIRHITYSDPYQAG